MSSWINQFCIGDEKAANKDDKEKHEKKEESISDEEEAGEGGK